MHHHLRSHFAKVVAAIYTAGTGFHVFRVATGFDLADMPFAPDWILVFAGSYGAAGMVAFAREIEYRGRWEVGVHWIQTGHLVVSVALHAWMLAVASHRALEIFPVSYSAWAAGYFALFAWRTWTLRLRPATARPSLP